MCAVVSCPFWAGWLNKITAHTPALVKPFKKHTLKQRDRILRVDEIYLHRVGNNALLVSFVQQQPHRLAATVGVVKR